MKVVARIAVDEGRMSYQKGWRLLETPLRCPRQRDAITCGVFTCIFGYKLSRNSWLLGILINPELVSKVFCNFVKTKCGCAKHIKHFNGNKSI